MSKKSKEKEAFQKEAYRLYQLDWMASHGFSVYDIIAQALNTSKEIEAELDAGDHASDQDVIEEIESSAGMGNGCIYVCYEEFLGAEYLDADYMRNLLDSKSYLKYLQLTKGERRTSGSAFQEGLTFDRAVELLQSVAEYIDSEHEESLYKIAALRDAGFSKEELSQLGFEKADIEDVFAEPRS